MDIYNDDWCQCPICFEIYSIVHRPTTFMCGHSVCIDHVYGKNSLEECPVCRYSLESCEEYHISYSLEEAVRVFNSLKTSIYWDILMKKKEEKFERIDTKTKEIGYYDQQYEEELQRKEHLLDEMYSTSNDYSHKSLRIKSCGHKCHLRLSNSCCICSIKYERSTRNIPDSINKNDPQSYLKHKRDYCSICKKHTKN